MKKLSYVILAFVIISISSCADKGPNVYTSIKGSWRCEEFNPLSGSSNYIVVIDRKLNDTTQYLLSNFENVNYEEFVFAQLTKNNLTISEQQIGTEIVKSGKGVVSANFTRIDLNYTIFDGQTEVKVQAIYSR